MQFGKITLREKKLASAAVAVAAGLLAATPAMSATAQIYNLGLFDSTLNQGQAINASGQVAGFGSSAFRTTGLPGSGGIEDTFGGTNSKAYAINSTGQVAGFTHANGGVNAFLYSGTPGSPGVLANLGTLGGLNSKAFGMNDSGEIVGESTTSTTSSYYNAMAYIGTPGNGGKMYNLGTLGGNLSFANAINSSGEIVGDSTKTGGAYEAFVYTGTPGSGGKMVALGTGLDVNGNPFSIANAINASGQITGWVNTVTGAAHAYRYSGAPGNNNAFLDLGTLGGNQSIGFGINDSGAVVGISTLSDSELRAFLYTGTPGSGGKITDLNAWLDANNPAAGADWVLTSATAISDTGLVTGYGIYNTPTQYGTFPYILNVSALLPEPGAISVLGLLGLGLLQRRRRPMGKKPPGAPGLY